MNPSKATSLPLAALAAPRPSAPSTGLTCRPPLRGSSLTDPILFLLPARASTMREQAERYLWGGAALMDAKIMGAK